MASASACARLRKTTDGRTDGEACQWRPSKQSCSARDPDREIQHAADHTRSFHFLGRAVKICIVIPCLARRRSWRAPFRRLQRLHLRRLRPRQHVIACRRCRRARWPAPRRLRPPRPPRPPRSRPAAAAACASPRSTPTPPSRLTPGKYTSRPRARKHCCHHDVLSACSGLLHYCRVCNTQLNSCKQVNIHVGGKKHGKRLNLLKFSMGHTGSGIASAVLNKGATSSKLVFLTRSWNAVLTEFLFARR